MSAERWIVASLLLTGCFSPEAPEDTEGGGEADASTASSTDPSGGPGSTDGTSGPSTTSPSTTNSTDTDDPTTDPTDTNDPTDTDDTDDPTTTGGAECGNGEVEGDEACDDGVNDGSYGGCNDDCTLAAYCGDGEIQAAEECDDGDELQGNGCNLDCVPSGLELWTHEEHVTQNDICVAIAPSQGAHVYLAAQIDNLDGGPYAGAFFAQRLSATGAVDWEQEHAPLATSTSHDYITYAAADAGDGLVMVGAHRVNATQPRLGSPFTDFRSVKLSAANGDVVWTRSDDGPAFPAGVVVDDDGESIVAALEQNTFHSYIYRFSQDGDAVGQPDYTAGGRATAIAFDPEGSFLVAAMPGDTIIQRRNAGFGVLWSADASPLVEIRDLTVGAEGDIFAVSEGRIGRRASADAAEVWTVETSNAASLGDPQSLAATGEGDLVVAGSRQGAPWIARLDPDGQVLWSRSASETGEFASVGVRADGSVIACGTIDGGGQGDNIFVATYTP